MEYEEARDIMARHKANVLKANGKGKVGRLAPNLKHLKYRTFLKMIPSPADDIDETYEIQYFHTAIVTLHSHKVTLNDGGWFSHSTHERLNEYMPRGFRVHGSRPRWYPNTLGFVRTPAGTVPYNMPRSFTYDGLPAGDQLFSVEAGACLHMIPNYVDSLLTLVFKEPNHLMNDIPATDDIHQLGDRLWPVALLKKQLHRPILLRHVFDDSWFQPSKEFHKEALGGENILNVVDILLREGATVFTKPKSRSELTHRIEAILRMGKDIPIINLRTLKKFLRKVLIEFLVDQLGFQDKEWNRRDAG